MKITHICLLCASVFLLSGCSLLGNKNNAQACIEGVCFELEIANTVDERATGLMDREELAADSGMLFVFENLGVHEFWMKNTLIPLDIIWMDEQGVVLYVKEYAPPCTKDPCQKFGPEQGVQSKYVLELNANSTREYGIYEGEKIDLIGLDQE